MYLGRGRSLSRFGPPHEHRQGTRIAVSHAKSRYVMNQHTRLTHHLAIHSRERQGEFAARGSGRDIQ